MARLVLVCIALLVVVTYQEVTATCDYGSCPDQPADSDDDGYCKKIRDRVTCLENKGKQEDCSGPEKTIIKGLVKAANVLLGATCGVTTVTASLSVCLALATLARIFTR
ncbi:uncharacterized protein LOC106013784 [Aplysia californica]|uniref:Uncharacterized protein LOC106013784 n=1 Tax=Aplysia californica TaxID=6500 RepID=A0ABM1ADZ7_APLCA|nr:uncharacterized protein LOC106013784 [Aplysia californica]